MRGRARKAFGFASLSTTLLHLSEHPQSTKVLQVLRYRVLLASLWSLWALSSASPSLISSPEEGGLAVAAGPRLQTLQPRCLDPRTRGGAEIQIHLLLLTAWWRCSQSQADLGDTVTGTGVSPASSENEGESSIRMCCSRKGENTGCTLCFAKTPGFGLLLEPVLKQ